MFVLGCKDLTVATDHNKPLLGIFNNCDISNIPNPCICYLKEKTLRCAFKTIYYPGKWQRGADAISRNPTSFSLDPTLPIHQYPSDEDIAYAESINDNLSQQVIPTLLNLINERPDHTPSVYNIETDMTLNNLEQVCSSDTTYQLLIKRTECGFPSTCQQLDAKIRDFWDVQDCLTIAGQTILVGDRIIIPTQWRKHILSLLHSAHQGITSMHSRVNKSVYWPEMNKDIRNKWYTCNSCNDIAPKQHQEPLAMTTSPL